MSYPTNQPVGQLPNGALGGGSNAYVDGDAVKVDDENGTNRVKMGYLGAGDYGLQVISSDGSTVIIDGNSDMFRITASGTLNDAAGCNGSGTACTSSVSVDVATGFTYSPAHLGFYQTGTTAGTALPRIIYDNSIGFANSGHITDQLEMVASVVSVNQTRIQVDWRTRVDRSGTSATYRYYILEQVAF
jgi:hypothetical protein